MTYSSAKFELQLQNDIHIARGNMLILDSNTSTVSYPNTYSVLENRLPSVLKTKCFNYRNLPFKEEVKCTELAHLFEHILLENICLSAIKFFKNQEIVARGSTSWDFSKYNTNVYLIEIYANVALNKIYEESVYNSISLMEEILT